MIRTTVAWIIEKLQPLAYKSIMLDSVNRKLIEPVLGLSGYYKFVNVADMPRGRFVHYLNLTERLKMNIDESDLIQYLDQMKKAIEAKDQGKYLALDYMLRDLIQNCSPIETYYWMAALYYFDAHEDLSTFDHDYNLRKVEYFKSLPNTAFFLARLIESLQKSGELLAADIEVSLREAQAKESQYSRMLSAIGKPSFSSENTKSP